VQRGEKNAALQCGAEFVARVIRSRVRLRTIRQLVRERTLRAHAYPTPKI